MEEKLQPIYAGEVLLEEFLKPLSMSQSCLALEIGVHPRRVYRKPCIAGGERGFAFREVVGDGEYHPLSSDTIFNMRLSQTSYFSGIAQHTLQPTSYLGAVRDLKAD